MSSRNGVGVIRVLLVSSSAVRRAGLESLIGKAPGLKLVASLHGVRTIAQRADELQPDVIIVDLESEIAMQLEWPVVALVESVTPEWAASALRSGVKAILLRDSGTDEILAAVQAAYAGFVMLDPELGLALAKRIRVPQRFESSEDLTERETEVLRLLGEGYSNREMAERLGISEHTVKFHISSILGKLGAETRTEAVSLGIRMGVIVV